MLAPAALLELLNRDPEAVGPLGGDPVVAVAVADDEATARCAELLTRAPCVAVGLDRAGRLPAAAAGLDVLVTSAPSPPAPWVGGDVERMAAGLAAAVRRSPAAAVVLVQLLRLGRHLDLRSALVAESLGYGLLQAGPDFRRWLAGEPPRPVHPAEGAVVEVIRRGDDLHLVLNRPDVHNAYDTAVRDALVEALALVAGDPTVGRVELSGAGPTFCSGGDLSEFGTTPDPVTGHLVRATRSAGWWLAAVADRVTARVHGSCLGAGVELPAFAATVIADPSATFRLPELEMGLIPGAGGTASLPRRIGPQRTAWLALTGTTLDAATALRWGLVDRLGDRRDAPTSDGC